MRIVFMGTPDFAAVSLKKLIEEKFDVVGVFCQPDKAVGRGLSVKYSPVKSLALENDIPVFQPEKMRDGTALSILQRLNPDVLVVVAYGRILPDDILELPKFGAINVHGSLLPKYRGAAPIQWAVINGDKTTGVTTMHLAHDMDAGNIIYSDETEIGEYETAGELFDRLAIMGANLLVKTLIDLERGAAPSIPQNHEEATYISMLDKSICPIDFTKTSREVIKHIYGLQPWPVATWGNLKIYAAEYGYDTDKPAGEIVSTDKKIEIACGDGKSVLLTELQAPGKKRMKSEDFLRGNKIHGC